MICLPTNELSKRLMSLTIHMRRSELKIIRKPMYFSNITCYSSRLLKVLMNHQKKSIKLGSNESRTLLFVLYKAEAPRVETLLRKQGYAVCSIHGNLGQQARLQALEDFKTGKVPQLVKFPSVVSLILLGQHYDRHRCCCPWPRHPKCGPSRQLHIPANGRGLRPQVSCSLTDKCTSPITQFIGSAGQGVVGGRAKRLHSSLGRTTSRRWLGS